MLEREIPVPERQVRFQTSGNSTFVNLYSQLGRPYLPFLEMKEPDPNSTQGRTQNARPR